MDSTLPASRKLLSKTTFRPLNFFLLVQVFFDPPAASVSLLTFRTILQHAIRQAFGTVVEARIALDVIKYDAYSAKAILRTTASDKSTLWCALAMFSQYETRKCYFQIEAASSFLFALISPRNPIWEQLQEEEEKGQSI